MGKKLFSLCMALVLCLVLLPTTALAAETAGEPQAVPSQTRTVGIWNFNDTSDSSGNGKNLTTAGAISFEDGWMKTQEGQGGNASVDLELNGGAGFSLSMAFSTIRAAGTGAGARTELFTLGSLSAVAYTTGELEVSLSGQRVGSAVGAVSDGGTNTLEVRIETDNALHVILNGEDIGSIADADVSGSKKLVIGNWSNSGYATSFNYVHITDTQPQPTGYTVTFNGNGGSGTMANQSFDYDEEKALTVNSFTWTGHDFTGWNTKADGNGTSYTDEQEVKNLTATDGGTVILYAQWKLADYSVTLEANGGTIADGKDVTSYTYGTGAALPTAEDITRDGYAFKGWYEDSGFSGSPVAEITAADTGAKNYYAKWVKLWTVTVTAGDGGTASGGGTFEENSTVTVTAVPDSGYRFIRWTENGAQVSADESYAFPLTGDRSLTAEFASNSSGGSSRPTYSPSLDVGDGGTVQVSPRTPEAGEEVTLTVTPDEGYAVEEVSVTDRDGDPVDVTAHRDGTYTFEQPRGRVTIEVTFREVSQGAPFADVPEDYWAYDAIAWAWENGYMNGTGAAFSPGASISRQQVWMILARLSGGAPADMTAARQWAVESGISDGTAPGGAVTRQQLAALLFRFAQANGYDSGQRAALTGFPDAASVSAYAVEALQWATASGIINGTSAGTLNPAGTATRAQFAVMLYRFWEPYLGA